MRYANRNPWLSSLLAVLAAIAMVAALSCSSEVDAAAAVEDVCARAPRINSVDMTAVGTERDGDTTRHYIVEIRSNENGMHQINYDGDRNPLAEIIAVDGRGYGRRMGENSQWGAWENLTVITGPPSSSSTSSTSSSSDSTTRSTGGSQEGTTTRSIDPPASDTLCGTWPLSDVQYLGTVTIDNTVMKHFKVSQDHTDIGGGVGAYRHLEYWHDSEGKLRQSKMEYYSPGISRPAHYIEIVATFSGHNEPNVITAPVVPQE